MAQDRAPANPPRKLGAYLLCSPALVRRALQRQGLSLRNPRRRRLGELLAEAGTIAPAELDGALRSQRIARLRACSLFATLAPGALAALANHFEEASCMAGEHLMHAGDVDPTLYVIASGQLEVYRVENGRELILAVVGAGEPIGEMGYFAGGVRNASVRALEATQLLRAPYADLTDYFENVPHVAHAFIEVVERRRAVTEARLRERTRRLQASPAPLSHLAPFVDLGAAARLGQGIEGSIEHLIRAAARVTDAERAALYMVDAGGGLWTMVAETTELAERRLAPGQGIPGWVAAHDALANVADAAADPRHDPGLELPGRPARTLLCAPVRDHAGTVVGVVQVADKRLGVFHEEDERLLRAFCEQISAAVRNLDVFRGLLRDHEVLTAVLDIATLSGTATELAGLGERLGARLAKLLGCDRCDVLFADYQRDELWCVERSDNGRQARRFELGALPAGIVAVDGGIVNIGADAGALELDPALHERLGIEVHNLLAVPLRRRDRELAGVVQAVNRGAGPFGPAEESLLAALAAQVGTSALLNPECAQETIS